MRLINIFNMIYIVDKEKFIFKILLTKREIMGHDFPILLMMSKRADTQLEI